MRFLHARQIDDNAPALQYAAGELGHGRSAVVGAVSAVEARGAAEFGYEHDHRLMPGVAHLALDRGNRAIERTEQVGKPALDDALVDVGVPAVKGERADPRTLRLREEFGRGAGRVGKVGANLGDAAALDHRALVTRLAVPP